MNRYLHHHLFYLFRKKELNEVYLTIAIRSLAFAMVSIFIPIYLLKLGYSFYAVMIFYAVRSFTHAVCVIPAAKIASKKGFKHAILFSSPLLIIFLLLLYLLEYYSIPIYLIAVIWGIKNSLYWTGYHADLSKFTDSKKRGQEISTGRVFTSIFGVLGPLVGGLILVFIGFNVLFISASFLILISSFPLFFSKDVHDPINFSVKKVFKKQKLRDYLAFTGFGFEGGASCVIWPIFLFYFIFDNLAILGSVYSLSLFFSLIFIFISGKFTDFNRKLALRVGGIMNAIIWTIRGFIKTGLQVFVIDSFYGVAQTLTHISFDARSYDKTDKKNVLKFTIFREIIINGSRGIFFIIMALISNYFLGFLLGAGGSLLYLFF